MQNKIRKETLKIASKIIYKITEKEANSACLLFSYQPRVPEKLIKR